MREILFRGFHPCEDGDKTVYVEGKAVKGRWVEGFVFEYHEVGICIGAEPLSANDYGEIYRDCYDVVLPSTVGQYTGLTDKNGVKIFEGDIVRHQDEFHNANGIIRFGDITDVKKFEYVGYYIEWINDGANMWGDWWRCDLAYWLKQKECKIIGNTHEEGRDERLD